MNLEDARNGQAVRIDDEPHAAGWLRNTVTRGAKSYGVVELKPLSARRSGRAFARRPTTNFVTLPLSRLTPEASPCVVG